MVAMNLLLNLESPSIASSATIIRNIMNTGECDQYYDLKLVRESTEKHINDGDKTRMARIIARDVREFDIGVVNEVLVEHRFRYLTALRKSLDWKFWFWYRFTESSNNYYMVVGSSAIFGATAALFGYSAKATFSSALVGNAIVSFFRSR